MDGQEDMGAEEMDQEIGEDEENMQDNGQIDFDTMDMRICGDLIEKNKKLDEFFMSQNLDGQIQVRIE
jgi:hypothetical protein